MVTLTYEDAGPRLRELKFRDDARGSRHFGMTRRLTELQQRRSELEGKRALREQQLERAGPPADPRQAAARAMSEARRAGATDASVQRMGETLLAERPAAIEDDENLSWELGRVDEMIATEEAARAELHRRNRSELVKACERWLQGECQGRPPALGVDADPALTKLSLDELRALIAQLDAEAAAIEAAPVPLTEAVAKLRSAVDAASRSGALSVARFMHADGGAELVALGLPAPGPWAVLAAAAPEQALGHGERELKTAYAGLPKSGPGAPIAARERPGKLAAIAAKRLSIEWREEVVVRAGEGTDPALGPVRRSDARPAIVLADTTEG